jgi:hypothetical protein
MVLKIIKMPNLIKVNENWALESDETCLTVYKRLSNKKTGKNYWKNMAYFGAGRFDQAYEYLVHLSICNLKSLEAVSKALKKVKSELCELFLEEIKEKTCQSTRKKK